MATISKFYLVDAVSPNTGTLPSSSPASVGAAALGGTVQGDATGAATARDATDVAGTSNPDLKSLITANATTTFQCWGHRRFVSRPLAAVTFVAGTGAWTFSAASQESNTSHNVLPTVCIYAWRPGTGAQIGTATTIALAEPGTVETALSSGAMTTGFAATLLDGDILVFDVFAQFTQAMATAYTDQFSYDGTTEASTTTCASFVTPPAALTLFTAAAARPIPNVNMAPQRG